MKLNPFVVYISAYQFLVLWCRPIYTLQDHGPNHIRIHMEKWRYPRRAAGIRFKLLDLSLQARYQGNSNCCTQKHNVINATNARCKGKLKIKDGDHLTEVDMEDLPVCR